MLKLLFTGAVTAFALLRDPTSVYAATLAVPANPANNQNDFGVKNCDFYQSSVAEIFARLEQDCENGMPMDALLEKAKPTEATEQLKKDYKKACGKEVKMLETPCFDRRFSPVLQSAAEAELQRVEQGHRPRQNMGSIKFYSGVVVGNDMYGNGPEGQFHELNPDAQGYNQHRGPGL